MKAPTSSTYQYYVLFRRSGRNAIEHARYARKCRKLGLYPSARLNYDKSRESLKDAKFYFSQVEWREV